jgi:hypothetical protein
MHLSGFACAVAAPAAGLDGGRLPATPTSACWRLALSPPGTSSPWEWERIQIGSNARPGPRWGHAAVAIPAWAASGYLRPVKIDIGEPEADQGRNHRPQRLLRPQTFSAAMGVRPSLARGAGQDASGASGSTGRGLIGQQLVLIGGSSSATARYADVWSLDAGSKKWWQAIAPGYVPDAHGFHAPIPHASREPSVALPPWAQAKGGYTGETRASAAAGSLDADEEDGWFHSPPSTRQSARHASGGTSSVGAGSSVGLPARPTGGFMSPVGSGRGHWGGSRGSGTADAAAFAAAGAGSRSQRRPALSPRTGHSAVWLPAVRAVVVFGGSGGTGYACAELSDTLLLLPPVRPDPSRPPDALPSARDHQHQRSQRQRELALLSTTPAPDDSGFRTPGVVSTGTGSSPVKSAAAGGTGSGRHPSGNGSEGLWTPWRWAKAGCRGPKPQGRTRHAACAVGSATVVVAGGSGVVGPLRDVWVLTAARDSGFAGVAGSSRQQSPQLMGSGDGRGGCSTAPHRASGTTDPLGGAHRGPLARGRPRRRPRLVARRLVPLPGIRVTSCSRGHSRSDPGRLCPCVAWWEAS